MYREVQMPRVHGCTGAATYDSDQQVTARNEAPIKKKPLQPNDRRGL